jgi:hypothetical protein
VSEQLQCVCDCHHADLNSTAVCIVDLQELIDEATAGPDQALQEEEQLRKGREADEEQNRQTALEVLAQSG